MQAAPYTADFSASYLGCVFCFVMSFLWNQERAAEFAIDVIVADMRELLLISLQNTPRWWECSIAKN